MTTVCGARRGRGWRTRSEARGQLGRTATCAQAVVQTLANVPEAKGAMESTGEWRVHRGGQHLGGPEVDGFKRDLGDRRRRVSTKLGHRISPECLPQSCWLFFVCSQIQSARTLCPESWAMWAVLRASHTPGFLLGLDNGRCQQAIRGVRKTRVGVFRLHSLPASVLHLRVPETTAAGRWLVLCPP